jgi:hypothetical protein
MFSNQGPHRAGQHFPRDFNRLGDPSRANLRRGVSTGCEPESGYFSATQGGARRERNATEDFGERGRKVCVAVNNSVETATADRF